MDDREPNPIMPVDSAHAEAQITTARLILYSVQSVRIKCPKTTMGGGHLDSPRWSCRRTDGDDKDPGCG